MDRQLQAEESGRTGITSLKVGYNKVFGYYIEITNANAAQGARPTTSASRPLKNAERYITDELKEYEEEGPHAPRSASRELEEELFVQSARARRGRHAGAPVAGRRGAGRARRAGRAGRAGRASAATAGPRSTTSDAWRSSTAATRSLERDACRASLRAQRHCASTPSAARSCSSPARTWPASPPTSARSRSSSLLAQIGCFVPAERGADRPGRPHLHPRRRQRRPRAAASRTFMVEMTETANILNNATAAQPDHPRRDRPRHLHLRRPVARLGRRRVPRTTTSRVPHALRHALPRADPAGATLCRGIAQLQRRRPRVEATRSSSCTRSSPGGADRSYGIQVARLAGLPRRSSTARRRSSRTWRTRRSTSEPPKIAAQTVRKNRAGSAAARSSDGIPTDDLRAGIRVVADTLRRLDLSGLTPEEALKKLD